MRASGVTSGRYASLEGSLLVIALIVVRRGLGGQPIFRIEFIVEDFILLLALALWVLPSRFQLLIGHVIGLSIGMTLTAIAWAEGPRKFSLILFALLAVCSAVRALIELSKLRKRNPASSGDFRATAPESQPADQA